MTFDELIKIGLSGWIIFILTLLLGGGFVVWTIRRRKTIQKNILAGGDVAGGNIRGRSATGAKSGVATLDTKSTRQENVTAAGDVAGGDIDKR